MSEKDEAVTGTDAGSAGGYVSTNPNESDAEHESMAIADSDSQQDPGETLGGGQMGG